MKATAEGGSATLWVLCCALLTLMAALVVVMRAGAVSARHRAQTAADLAALAGAGRIGVGTDYCLRAGQIAAANNATLRSCVVSIGADGRSGTVGLQVSIPVNLGWGFGARDAMAHAKAQRFPPS